MRFQIPVSFLKIDMQLLFAGAADDTTAGAIAAIGCAPIGDQKEDAIRVPMDQSGNRHVGIFAARVGHFERRAVSLLNARDHLAPVG